MFDRNNSDNKSNGSVLHINYSENNPIEPQHWGFAGTVSDNDEEFNLHILTEKESCNPFMLLQKNLRIDSREFFSLRQSHTFPAKNQGSPFSSRKPRTIPMVEFSKLIICDFCIESPLNIKTCLLTVRGQFSAVILFCTDKKRAKIVKELFLGSRT